jgi:anti-anti-sigma factor
MEILQTVSDDGKAAALGINEPIDSSNAEELKSRIEELVSNGFTAVIVDLSHAGYVAAKGLSVIGYINKKMRGAQGLLVLTGLNREISAVFSLLGFLNDCTIASTMDDAREMISRSSGGSFSSSQTVLFGKRDAQTVNENIAPVLQEEKPPVQVAGETAVQEGESLFPQPLIVECEECCSFVRVHSSGQFMCPSCHVEFHVERDGTVIF